MTVLWQRIPGKGLYANASQTKKAREAVLKRLIAALGKPLTESLITKELLVLLPSFDGYPLLNAIAGRGILPMEHACCYIKEHNTVYVNLEHHDDPSLLAQVISTMAYDTMIGDNERLEIYRHACYRVLLDMDPTARDNHEKRSRVRVRSMIDRIQAPKALLQEYWMAHHEGKKPLDLKKVAARPKKQHKLMESLMSEKDIVNSLLAEMMAFTAGKSNRAHSRMTLEMPVATSVRLATLVKPTDAKLPSTLALFGKSFNEKAANADALLCYPADMGDVTETDDARNSWSLLTETAEYDWEDLIQAHAPENGEGDPMFATGVAMASKPQPENMVDAVVTRQVDPMNHTCRLLNFLPFVAAIDKPVTASFVSCQVPSSLDWAILRLKAEKYRLDFDVLCTSWLVQCSKLKSHFDYQVNLAFWAMEVENGLCEAAVEKAVTPAGEITRYRISGKISSVKKETDDIQGLEYKVVTVSSVKDRKAFPKLTVAMPLEKFKELELKRGSLVTVTGIFLMTGANAPREFALDELEMHVDIPEMNPLQYRRYVSTAAVQELVSPKAMGIHFARWAQDAIGHQRGRRYPRLIAMAASLGHYDSLMRMETLYRNNLAGRFIGKDIFDYALLCDGAVANRFFHMCQLDTMSALDFLAINESRWLPAAPDVKERLLKHSAFDLNSGRAYQQLALNLKAKRAFAALKDAEKKTYQGLLMHAVFESGFKSAAKYLCEIFLANGAFDIASQGFLSLVESLTETVPEARSWFASLVVLQNRFCQADEKTILEALKVEAASGSPVYITALAWFMMTTAWMKPETPSNWMLAGFGLMRWLAKHYDCPAYIEGIETMFMMLESRGITKYVGSIDPWKYLKLEAPEGTVPLLRSVRPMGLPSLMHNLVFNELIERGGKFDSPDQLHTRIASIFDFMADNAEEIMRVGDEEHYTPGENLPPMRLLSLNAKGKNACVITQSYAGEIGWHSKGMCPVFSEGRKLTPMIAGGFTDITLTSGVISATLDGKEMLHFFDPYWIADAPALAVGDKPQVKLFGIGVAQYFGFSREELKRNGKFEILECDSDRLAQYSGFATVKSLKLDAVEIAGVMFSKLTVSVRNVIAEDGKRAPLTLYIPSKLLDPRLILSNVIVELKFELVGFVEHLEKESEIIEELDNLDLPVPGHTIH